MPPKINDLHNLLHERWLTRRNRKLYEPHTPDDWYNFQCYNCLYYILLSGPLGNDWGVCSNEKSKFDGTVRFEHDGCEFHTSDEQQ